MMGFLHAYKSTNCIFLQGVYFLIEILILCNFLTCFLLLVFICFIYFSFFLFIKIVHILKVLTKFISIFIFLVIYHYYFYYQIDLNYYHLIIDSRHFLELQYCFMHLE